jgi:DNA invertase Pin-like site-specific DNA recombinase
MLATIIAGIGIADFERELIQERIRSGIAALLTGADDAKPIPACRLVRDAN